MKAYIRRKSTFGQWTILKIGDTLGHSFTDQEPDRTDLSINIIMERGEGLETHASNTPGMREFITTWPDWAPPFEWD